MTPTEDLKARLIESISVCRLALSSNDISDLDREYMEGQRDAFKLVLRFLLDE